jgi:hypothetical protein
MLHPTITILLSCRKSVSRRKTLRDSREFRVLHSKIEFSSCIPEITSRITNLGNDLQPLLPNMPNAKLEKPQAPHLFAPQLNYL